MVERGGEGGEDHDEGGSGDWDDHDHDGQPGCRGGKERRRRR